MALTAIVAIGGAVVSAYSANTQRKSAKESAAQIDRNAREAAAQAAESARGAALTQQTAIERSQAEAQARINAEAAQIEGAPNVEVSASATPTEATRRRKVRAQFDIDETANDNAGGSIRV